MKKNSLKRTEPATYRGPSFMTDENVGQKIRQITGGEQFYEVDLAQVRKVLTKEDVNEQTYPIHQNGAILCRILYDGLGADEGSLTVMLPRKPNHLEVPVVGEIVLCSKHPSNDMNVQDNMVFDQYYYFGILNILNQVNNNSLQDVSYINEKQQAAQQDSDKLGRDFYINKEIAPLPYSQGDIILSGRYGHAIKFTSNKGQDDKKMLPSIIISNDNSGLVYEEQERFWSNAQSTQGCGSYVGLIKVQKEPQSLPKLPSERSLLDNQKQYSLIGNNILGFSDRIIVSAKTNDVQVYANQNVEVSSNNNVFVESDKITIEGKTQITLKVGDSEIKITKGGITIKSSNVTIEGDTAINGQTTIDGVTTIKGIQNGATPGFTSISVCPFSGAPHTINTVG